MYMHPTRGCVGFWVLDIACNSNFIYLYGVKKAVAIFFMGIYMLAFAELHQFLRLPILVQHFVEHQQRNPGISLLAFLEEHYVHQYIHDADYQRDNQLPFRDADCCVVTASAAVTFECPQQNIVNVTAQYVEKKNEFVLNDEENHSLLSVADIFQPPRV